MIFLLRLAVRIYPRAWRKRYGTELEALLEDSGGGWRVLADLVWGATKMRMTTVDFRILAGMGMAGLAIAAIVSYQMPDRFRSEAVALVTLGDGVDHQRVIEALIRAEGETLSRTSLASLIEAPDLNLYQTERTGLPLEDVVERMKHRDLLLRVAAQPVRGNTAVIVSYTGDSALLANKTTQKLLDQLTANLEKDNSAGRVRVIDPPNLPGVPVRPNRLAIALAGLIGGIASGMLVAGIKRWPRAALIGAACAASAFAASFAIPNRYVSSAVVQVANKATADRAASKVLGNTGTMRAILDAAGRGAKREDVGIRVASQTLVVTVVSRDRLKAQTAAQLVIEGLRNASPESAGVAEVQDPASYPTAPIFPNHLVIATLGLVSGLVPGMIMQRRAKALA